MLIAGTILFLVPPVFVVLYLVINYWVAGRKSICIVVLGDVGRSPRMQYHALSFIETGFSIELVGYSGSEIQDGLKKSQDVTIHYLTEPPRTLKYFPRLLVYFLKVLWQAVTLGLCLMLMPKCGYILLQNPPCIPALAVSWVVCWLRGSRLMVDWHNYGYSILELSLRKNHPLVKFAKWYEKLFGRLSSANICVTKAMKEDLSNNWGIRASVMYDRPPAMFKEANLHERHRLFVKLAQEYTVFRSSETGTEISRTAFTSSDPTGEVNYIENRPALLVSSTSWTEDEDFSVLLDALREYEIRIRSEESHLPDIVCVITGKGPQKENYTEKISSLDWKHVRFCLPWLSPEDYPVLLGSADLGVCLHMSSSGLDLPMKVVDMFGCCLPVCAIHFNCLNELVKHEENGLIFHDSQELSKQIQDLFEGFPLNQGKIQKFRKNLSSFQAQRWQECWERDVLPLFTESTKQKKDS